MPQDVLIYTIFYLEYVQIHFPPVIQLFNVFMKSEAAMLGPSKGTAMKEAKAKAKKRPRPKAKARQRANPNPSLKPKASLRRLARTRNNSGCRRGFHGNFLTIFHPADQTVVDAHGNHGCGKMTRPCAEFPLFH